MNLVGFCFRILEINSLLIKYIYEKSKTKHTASDAFVRAVCAVDNVIAAKGRVNALNSVVALPSVARTAQRVHVCDASERHDDK